MEITENSKTLKFDANGLIPAIVQDHYTKEVLTLAYMNAETLALTIAEGRTVFWSRSRREIWRKGETSGNVQRVVSITADCDKDALVIDVVKSGPACHTGAESCFFNPVYVSDELKQFTWQGLYALIDPQKGRRGIHRGHHCRLQARQGGDHLRDQRPGLPRHGADDRAGHFRRGHHEGTRKTTRN